MTDYTFQQLHVAREHDLQASMAERRLVADVPRRHRMGPATRLALVLWRLVAGRAAGTTPARPVRMAP